MKPKLTAFNESLAFLMFSGFVVVQGDTEWNQGTAVPVEHETRGVWCPWQSQYWAWAIACCLEVLFNNSCIHWMPCCSVGRLEKYATFHIVSNC